MQAREGPQRAERAARRRRAKPGSGKGWLAIAAAAVPLGAGAAVRLHGLERSLWLDEAWVANSVLEPSLGAMLRYEAWLQTSPPLFLLLVRGAVALAGESNLAWRAVPALFSLAALGLFAALALRWLRPPAALAALALFAFAPRLVVLGASLKPYASDAFAALSMLAVGDAYLARPSGRRLALALGSAGLLSLLSFPAPLFLPALLVAPALHRGRPTAPPPWHALATIATGALVAAVVLLLFVLPNREPSLLEYFRSGFFPGGGPLALGAWIGGRLLLLGSLVPGLPGGAAGEGAALLLGALGIAGLARRGRAGEASALARSLLLALPIAGVVASNLVGLYPMARGNARPLAFLLPIAALALGAGLDSLALAAGRLRARAAARAVAAAGWLALAALLAALLGAAQRGELRELFERPPVEDAEGAVAFLAREVGADDLLYVHSSMRESFRLYARRTPPAARAVQGEVDAPCCPRGRPYRRDEDPAQALPAEIARIAAAGAGGRRLFVLVTDREAHFRQRGSRSPAALELALRAIGCRRAATETLRGVRVDRYACAPDRGV